MPFSHSNLPGFAADNFTKGSLLQALPVTYDYTTCLSGTFLDSSISN